MKNRAKKLLAYLINIHIEQPEYLEDMFQSLEGFEELNEEQRKELFEEVDNIAYRYLLPRLEK